MEGPSPYNRTGSAEKNKVCGVDWLKCEMSIRHPGGEAQ